jgi:hypothetical protein
MKSGVSGSCIRKRRAIRVGVTGVETTTGPLG